MEPISRAVRLERLLAALKRVLAATEKTQLLEATLDGAIEYLAGDHGFVLRRSAESKPRVKAVRNLTRETLKSDRFRPIRKIADYVLSEGEPFLSASMLDDSRYPINESLSEVPRTVVAVPMRASAAIHGALYVDKLHNGMAPFDVEDLRVMQEFADAAGMALEMRMLVSALQEESSTARRRYDDLSATLHNLQEDVAAKSVELSRYERVIDTHRRALGQRNTFNNIIGRSPKMQRVFDVLNQVMEYPVPVLISGESGTGKELIARALHYGGPRREQPFMAINCAAIPENLLESELFGFKKGAFTGATTDKEGLFRAAGEGTVFLDEIGEMPLSIQAKLLRVLQEKEVRPIGGRSAEPVGARIVAATNRRLVQEVSENRFREDLYYRLNVVEVHIPALRDRLEDVPDLANHFLERLAEEFGMPNKRFTPAALQRLMQTEWRGNVRQLENAIKSSAILSKAELIQPEELQLPVEVNLDLRPAYPTSPLGGANPIANRGDWEEHDKRRILDAMVRLNWNKTRVATELGISRRNLYRKLARYGIEGVM